MIARTAFISGLVSALALGGCASSNASAPVCDGKHRRAVNIYGSVLGQVPTSHLPRAASDGPAKAAPSPGPLPAKAAQTADLSRAARFPSC